MAQGSSSNNAPLVRQAGRALDQFKYEVAGELNISPEYQTGYWGNIPARECGAVGGHMVRRMIAAAEQSLIQGQTAAVKGALNPQSLGANPAWNQPQQQPWSGSQNQPL